MALGDTVLVQLGDGITSPKVTIKITEDALGNFKFEVTQSGPIVGDLQGIFFDVGGTGAGGVANDALLASTANSTSISGLTATGSGPQLANLASTIQDGNDSVKDLGNGNNMNGALGFNDTGAEAKGYDVGIGFGTSGIGKDDVRSVSFTFNNSIGLTIDDFIGMDFGVRMTSVGTLGGARDGSVKLTSSSFEPIADDCEDIDCVVETDSASGNVFDPVIEGEGGVTLTQSLKSFTLYDEDGNVVGSSTVDGYGVAIELPNTEGATITFNTDGSYTVQSGSDALNATDHLPFKLTYTLSQTYTDINGHVIGHLEDTSSLKFDICGENDDPDATNDDAGCIVEGGSASGNVILGTVDVGGEGAAGGADDDIDRGDVLTVTQVTYDGVDYELGDDGTVTIDLNGDEEGGATLTMNADGTWSFATNGMYDGLVEGDDIDLTFNYTVVDGNGGTADADLLLCVKGEGPPGGGGPGNEPPDAVDDPLACVSQLEAATSGVTGNVLDNDTDPDDDPLTLTSVNGVDLVNGVANITLTDAEDNEIGTLEIHEDGSFTFFYTGPYSDEDLNPTFTYTISDGHEGADTATVTLCLEPLDDPGRGEALSPGGWTNPAHSLADSENLPSALAAGTLSFDDFFNLDDGLNPVADRTWTDNATSLQDLTLSAAFRIGTGPGNGGDSTTPNTVAGNELALARQASVSVANFYDDDGQDDFVAAYIYQRAISDNNDTLADNPYDEASVLADLKMQVHDAFEGATGAYSIDTLSNMLNLTHEA